MTKKQAKNLLIQKNHQLNALENLQGKKRLETTDIRTVLRYEIENLQKFLKSEVSE